MIYQATPSFQRVDNSSASREIIACKPCKIKLNQDQLLSMAYEPHKNKQDSHQLKGTSLIICAFGAMQKPHCNSLLGTPFILWGKIFIVNSAQHLLLLITFLLFI